MEIDWRDRKLDVVSMGGLEAGVERPAALPQPVLHHPEATEVLLHVHQTPDSYLVRTISDC